jgi:pyruvate formate-lyase activating enzyme-like uncharacterized protein
MPRFYFHVKDGADIRDEVGTELPSIDAARNQAIASSSEMIRDLGRKFRLAAVWQMTVTDENGQELFELSFTATIKAVS